MINLSPAEYILKGAYAHIVAESLKANKKPVHEKVICSGFRRTYKAPEENKIGRNNICPCGSGKKYKNCCMKGENNGSIRETQIGD